jgi:hypothetical protein
MTSAALPLPHAPATTTPVLDGDLSLFTVANALLACYARGADRQTMTTMCERLLSVAEHELIERERKMMASGDPDLALHVRRHGDVLLVLSRQVRDCRRTSTPPSRTFINFVGALVERMRGPTPPSAAGN